jgi:hypothetical protein
MKSPLAKSVSTAEKCKRLLGTAGSEDTLAILIRRSGFNRQRFCAKKIVLAQSEKGEYCSDKQDRTSRQSGVYQSIEP